MFRDLLDNGSSSLNLEINEQNGEEEEEEEEEEEGSKLQEEEFHTIQRIILKICDAVHKILAGDDDENVMKIIKDLEEASLKRTLSRERLVRAIGKLKKWSEAKPLVVLDSCDLEIFETGRLNLRYIISNFEISQNTEINLQSSWFSFGNFFTSIFRNPNFQTLRKGVTFFISMQNRSEQIFLDPEKLQQLIENLLYNAFEATL